MDLAFSCLNNFFFSGVGFSVLLVIFLFCFLFFTYYNMLWILLGLENSSGKDEASLIGITQAQGSFSLKGKLFELSLLLLHCFQE